VHSLPYVSCLPSSSPCPSPFLTFLIKPPRDPVDVTSRAPRRRIFGTREASNIDDNAGKRGATLRILKSENSATSARRAASFYLALSLEKRICHIVNECCSTLETYSDRSYRF